MGLDLVRRLATYVVGKCLGETFGIGGFQK